MKTTNFTNLGGLKFTQDRLGKMQDSYLEGFAALAQLCGDYTILSGVEVTGSNVSGGWISVGGELIRFLPCTLAVSVIISTAATALVFADSSVHDVHFDKTAVCGSFGNFPFADLTPLTSLKNIWKKDDLRMCKKDTAYINASFDPTTGIGITPEEKGWQILSKQDVNAAGKAFVNIDPNDTDFDEAGKIAGSKTHVLSVDEMPSHFHKGSPAQGFGVGNGLGGSGGLAIDRFAGRAFDNAQFTNNVGGSQAHNNVQPSYAILTLIKL